METDGVRCRRAAVWAGLASGYMLALLAGLFAGVLLIPGDGNPGHIFTVAILGFCGLLVWIRRSSSPLASIAICIVLLVVSWPIAIALRDSTAALMPGLDAGHRVLWWLRQLLPAALFVVGITRWMQTRSWAALAVAVIPLSVQLGYIMLRSSQTAQIDCIERSGIIVTGTVADGYYIGVIHDMTDNSIQASFDELKRLPGIRGAIVHSKNITDDGICLMSQLPEIESLELKSVCISRKGFECLSKMAHLRRLRLIRVTCDGKDMAGLSSSQSLQMLVIGDCALSDGVIEHIAELTALRNVSFVGTGVSECAVKELSSKRPDLGIELQ